MSIEVGVLIESTAQPPGDADAAGELATAAEANGLDLVVVPPADGSQETSGIDTWTMAAWLAARTRRIAIGVPEARPVRSTRGTAFGITTGTPDAERPVPSVVARARESLDILAGPRLVTERGDATGDASWQSAPRDAGIDELSALAEDGLPVVVPVRSVADVDRVGVLAAELRATMPSRPRRSAAVRSRRVAGIDYDDVPESLAADAVEPGDRAHRSVSSTYLRGGAPGLVLRPRTTDQVVDAVAFARRHPQVALGIRSGGHGISGRSTNRGGLVIDVGRLNEIEVIDREQRLVRIGPGATWKQVSAALHPYGWALGSGDYGGVGVGGLATAAGIGLLSRRHGLTIDHLRAVELVLADGSRVRASEREHPELFWAVRGAGSNFGIATAFEFQVDVVDDVGWAKLTLVSPDVERSLTEFGDLATSAARDTTVFLVTGPPRDGQSVLQLFSVVADSDSEVIIERLTPFVGLGMLAQQEVAVMPYRDVMAQAADPGPDGHHGYGDPVSRSAFLPTLTPEFARDAARLLESGAVRFFQLRTMGGAIADVPPEAMAFSHRSVAFQVTAMGTDDDALNAAWDVLRHHFDGLYLSFETDRRPERLLDAFPEPALGRLRELKRRYDPRNLFRDNFNIDPADDSAVAPTLEAAS
ncbi:MAG TPA: LLM class flavin-dependent oxidoreductase [Agromyces sp.]